MWEEVREAHGELRALAQRVADPLLRQEMLAACGRLAAASSRRPGAGEAVPALSPREVDVLACVASGATNAVVAERLGLRPGDGEELSAVLPCGSWGRTPACRR